MGDGTDDPLERRIANFIRAFKSNVGTFLLVAGGILGSSAVLLLPHAAVTLAWISIAVTVSGAVITSVMKPRMAKALEAARKREIALKYSLRQTLTEILETVAPGENAKSRVSIYRHVGDRFVLVERVSGSDVYEQTGRTSYPDNEGVIGKTWSGAEGVVMASDLPADKEKWVQKCIQKWNCSETSLRGMRMRSRNLIGFRIASNLETPRKTPIGVLILETTEPGVLKGRDLDVIRDHQAWPLISALLPLLSSYLTAEDALSAR